MMLPLWLLLLMPPDAGVGDGARVEELDMKISARTDADGNWCSGIMFDEMITNLGPGPVWLDVDVASAEMNPSSYSLFVRQGRRMWSRAVVRSVVCDLGARGPSRRIPALRLAPGESFTRTIQIDTPMRSGQTKVKLSVEIHGTDDPVALPRWTFEPEATATFTTMPSRKGCLALREQRRRAER
jgi:hypothetical protein